MKVSIRSAADGPDAGHLAPLPPAALRRFRAALLAWYRPRGRALRIRATRDPWAILVSEVMAQQTQIARVDKAWTGFMARFPSPRALARASTAEVVRAWAGLGYNRRAVNLQRAALVIESDHAGRVPSTIAELEALPGVGPYTARAVAAIAFDAPVAAVDTNVRRVVTRVFGRPMGARELQRTADALVDQAHPATWTHASMELGATVCVTRRPICEACPLRRWCASVDAVEPVEPGARPATVPFERTSRWLRGRVIEHLRALDEGDWTRLPATIGHHGQAEISAALASLERDGLLERAPDGSVRLPSA